MAPQLGPSVSQLIERTGHAISQSLADGGQGDAAPVPGEQGMAEFVFQHPELPADRAVSDVQFLSCTAYAA